MAIVTLSYDKKRDNLDKIYYYSKISSLKNYNGPLEYILKSCS